MLPEGDSRRIYCLSGTPRHAPEIIPQINYIPARSFMAISLSMPNRRTLCPCKSFAYNQVQLKECAKRFRHLNQLALKPPVV